MASNYEQLVNALRCNQGNGLCPYADCEYKSKNAPICMPTRLTNDAAAAIEHLMRVHWQDEALIEANEDAIKALEAEVGQWKAAVKGQEDGIKVLQAEVKRLKECIDELREAQTYIDRYGDKWMTSAKDVPTAAYEHGYEDGRDEAMAKMEVQDGQ